MGYLQNFSFYNQDGDEGWWDAIDVANNFSIDDVDDDDGDKYFDIDDYSNDVCLSL